GRDPERAALRRRADALRLLEVRSRVGPTAEQLRELVVSKAVVKGQRRERLSARGSAERQKHEELFHARSLAAFSRIGRMRLNSARNRSAVNAVKPNTRPGRVGSTA